MQGTYLDTTQMRIDTSARLSRILHFTSVYFKVAGTHLRAGQTPVDLLRKHLPFAMPQSKRPVYTTVELTNVCNLRCDFCQSPLGLRRRGSMSEATFKGLLRGIKSTQLSQVHMVGNGESTLHPRFADYAKRLGDAVSMLSIVSNGQWQRRSAIDGLLAANRVDISVAGRTKEDYEANRLGASWERLHANLADLREASAGARRPPKVVLRVMMRPSDSTTIAEVKRFWAQLADVIYVMPVVQQTEVPAQPDVFGRHEAAAETMPRCARTLVHVVVAWNGDVPLCGPALFHEGDRRIVLGNVTTDDLADIFSSPTMRAYREAHRRRVAEQAPACVGCRNAF